MVAFDKDGPCHWIPDEYLAILVFLQPVFEPQRKEKNL
jgi:hypothetical protein